MPGRILIVDDLPTNRLLLNKKLTAAYFDVLEAPDGPSALEIARREEPDLILLDVMMPGMDGLETCRRLKEDSRTHHIPVMMLTALGEHQDRVRGLDAGADDFLSRPFEDVALIARVNNLVRVKLMIDELRLRHETSIQLGFDDSGLRMAFEEVAGASVLMVCDEDCASHSIRRRAASALGCAIETARGEEDMRALVSSNHYDAFIIGDRVRDGQPLRIASFLRARPETRQAPTMMMFPADGASDAIIAMNMGVSDSLAAPPDPSEFIARLRVLLRRKYYSDRLRNAVRDTIALAATDPLTGLYNRRYANGHLDSLIAKAEISGNPLVAMMLDLDRFKTINDACGHVAGDAVLKEFAARLQANLRGIDLVARIGGEEFLVVMPETGRAAAEQIAERVRHAIESTSFAIPATGESLAVTVSIGLALFDPGEDGAALIARADRALYSSKSGGRNRVTLAAAA